MQGKQVGTRPDGRCGSPGLLQIIYIYVYIYLVTAGSFPMCTW